MRLKDSLVVTYYHYQYDISKINKLLVTNIDVKSVCVCVCVWGGGNQIYNKTYSIYL